MQEELRNAVEKYSRSIIQSEAEVESKLIVPLTELLGYPSEFRAEQFPVHGFQPELPEKLTLTDWKGPYQCRKC